MSITTTNNDFGRLVSKHLKQKERRRADLARMTQYSASYITNILNGLRAPSPDAVNRIAAALELDVNATVALNLAAAHMQGFKTKKSHFL